MRKEKVVKSVLLSLALSLVGSQTSFVWEADLNNYAGNAITITSDSAYQITSADHAYGILNGFTGEAQFGTINAAAHKLTVEAHGTSNKNAYAILNAGSHLTAGDLVVTATSTGGGLVGGIINESVGPNATGSITAGNVTVDISGTGNEIYGIRNGAQWVEGVARRPVSFTAKDIKITGTNPAVILLV